VKAKVQSLQISTALLNLHPPPLFEGPLRSPTSFGTYLCKTTNPRTSLSLGKLPAMVAAVAVPCAAAATAFLDTVEIFEMNMLHLPIADVIRYTRVDSVWRTRILSATPQLQGHLFLLNRAPEAVDGSSVTLNDPGLKLARVATLTPCYKFRSSTRERRTSSLGTS
jgi:hypothetical protein